MDDDVLFRSLLGRVDGAERAAVEGWRQASAENERRYQELARLLAVTSAADSLRSFGTPPAVVAILRATQTVSDTGIGRQSSLRAGLTWATQPWFRRAAGLAATLVLGLALWRFGFKASTAADAAVHEVVTGPSTAITVTLRDGSVVRLGSNSHLRVEPGGGEVFLDGRAYFAVAKQKAGPLRIRTAAGDVRVVGTRFDLEANGGQLRLVVVEGRVVVGARGSESDVSAGEMARVVEGVPMPVIQVPRSEAPVEWLGNFLAFQETPLRDAAREIERQFGIHVRITDPALGSQTVTGWFAGWTWKEVMDVVCVVTNAACTTTARIVIMESRTEPQR